MYKSLLVHIDDSAASAARTSVAIELALAYEAHLTGCALTGIPPHLFPYGGYDPGITVTPILMDQLRAEADRALTVFEEQARQAGLQSIEARRGDDEPGWGISMQARYCDLVVIGRAPDERGAARLRSDFPEFVLLNSPRPVLVVPPDGVKGPIGKRVTVAWNGKPDAVRAIASALPLLQRAHYVDVVLFDPEKGSDGHAVSPGAEIGVYLARHGIRLQITVADAKGNVGRALLDHASAQQSDMIVMGAYGHSRLREILIGGTTRSMLRESTLPLWMAH